MVITLPSASKAEGASLGQTQSTPPNKTQTELPAPPSARAWLVAPSAEGPWVLRIDNESTGPIRIPADVRLLELTALTGSRLNKRKVTCSLPSGLKPDGFPERRALVLGPKQSYIETFDPHLFCFGKQAELLRGGTTFQARFGWASPSRYSKKAEGPFAAEPLSINTAFSAQKGIQVPTLALSYDQLPSERAESGGSEPQGVPATRPESNAQSAAEYIDEKAPRFEVTSEAYSDAARGRVATVTIAVKNAGNRTMLTQLRPRMISALIEGPSGITQCAANAVEADAAKESFRTLKAGETTKLSVVLAEICPPGTLDRPGLYRVTPTLNASQSGERAGVDAFTGVARSNTSTLLRVANGSQPYYSEAASAVPTPPSQVELEDEGAR